MREDPGRNGLTPWSPAALGCFKPLSGIEEQEARWVIPGWMPAEQITPLAADGGVGKTALWVSLLAALSSGRPCFLDPPGLEREAMDVAFLTTEDSVSKKLKRKLRLAGADERRIITMDVGADALGALRDFKLGLPLVDEFVRCYRPAVCVFDPIQGFLPPEVNMGSRNAMRDCMAPLIALGEECAVSFLIVCHTNKRRGAAGRERISDSADLWDVARCVHMAGDAGNGLRYLANEKNNYAPLCRTRLFRIDENGLVVPAGETEKRDRDFVQELERRAAPGRAACREWVLDRLSGGEMPLKTLYEEAEARGYSTRTVERAMNELSFEQRVVRYQDGYRSNKRWYAKQLSGGDRDLAREA